MWVAALLVSTGYYLAVEVGLSLTFHPQPISVLWPANAVLLAALLIAPERAWLMLLLAALPPHLIGELGGGVPLRMLLCWYLSNCTEALLGAALVRRLNPEPLRLDSVRGLTLFVAICTLVAPFLSSFLDAALVAANQWGGSGYWAVWRARFLSNMLAALIVVPVLLEAHAAKLRAIRRMSASRQVEAAILGMSILLMCAVAFLGRVPWTPAGPARIYAPLPFLLWAAVRFGTYGTGLSLATMAVTSIWGATHGNGPFAALTPSGNALSLQLFLVLTALPVSMVATLIAERARTTDELRESRRIEQAKRDDDERMAVAAASMNIGFWSYDIGTRRLWVTHQYRSILGMTSDVELTEAAPLTMIHADDRNGAIQVFADVGRKGGALETEFRVVGSDGVIRHVAISGRAERDLKGDVRRITGLAIDVTERYRAEGEATQRRRELEHLGRVATLGELSGALAHELAQPLTAIMTNAQVAYRLLQREPIDVPLLREILSDIVRDDRRGANVIQHLRQLLRNEESAREQLDMRELTHNVLTIERSDLLEHKIEVAIHFADDVRPVLGDRVQLEQVLLNLIMNARDSMDAVPSHDRYLRVEIAQLGPEVRVSIRDSGLGIPPDKLQLVFESFYTTKPKGLGLGLAICQAIVGDHGGRLWAESDGNGAVLLIVLPSAVREASPDPTPGTD